MEQLILREFAGQHKDVEIVKRDDDSIFIRFLGDYLHYGYPSLELNKLRELVKRAEDMGVK